MNKHMFSLQWLRETQEGEERLQAKAEDPRSNYHFWQFEQDIQLVCHTPAGKDPEVDWAICLADGALTPAVNGFHQMLNHSDRTCLLQGMQQYYHLKLRKTIDNLKCDAFQRYKQEGRGSGHLAPRDVITAP